MQIQPSDLIEENRTPYQLFISGFPNKQTLTTNQNYLKKVLCDYLKLILRGDENLLKQQEKEMMLSGKKLHHLRNYYDADFEIRVNEFVRRAKQDPKWIDTVLMTLVSKLMERTKLEKTHPDYMKSTNVENTLKPFKKLFKMTDIPIAWGKITSQINDDNDIKDQSRGYMLKELQKIIKFCDPMETVIVKLGSSSGIRAGAYDLKWGHIMPVYQDEYGTFIWEPEEITESVSTDCKIVCGVITVYADSNSEYYGFVTPEWLDDLEIYKQLWIKETNSFPKDSDPLFKRDGDLVRPLTISGIRARLTRVVDKAGIRVKIDGIKQKYNIPIFNGTRRFFNKQNKQALSNTSLLSQLILKEIQMGHGGLIKLDKNYFKEHVDELITEYIYTVPYVTIDSTQREKQEKQKIINDNKEKDAKISELENVKLVLQQTIKEKDEMAQKSNDAFFSSNTEKLITQKVKEILEKQNT